MVKTFKHANTTILVSDLDKAIKFYTEILGLRLRYKSEHWATVKAPGVDIGLHPAKGKRKKQSGNLSIGFDVNDLDAAVNHLKSKGLKFKLYEEGNMRLAFFSDYDGTQLYLMEMKNL